MESDMSIGDYLYYIFAPFEVFKESGKLPIVIMMMIFIAAILLYFIIRNLNIMFVGIRHKDNNFGKVLFVLIKLCIILIATCVEYIVVTSLLEILVS
ncbi:MAG: hypothetical protein N2749_06055 [Clostridia bacterium]|nr:hypothetical protein [Clostridia bacterium]